MCSKYEGNVVCFINQILTINIPTRLCVFLRIIYTIVIFSVLPRIRVLFTAAEGCPRALNLLFARQNQGFLANT